jgi:hypothetical protein
MAGAVPSGLSVPAGAGRRRRRRRLAVLFFALLVGPFLAEGLLRWLLFSSSALAGRLGARLRDPGLYVAVPNSDDHTKLFLLFRLGERMRHGIPPYADPEVGWLKAEIDPATYRHSDDGELAGRRPVLFYGSSFAACAGHEDECFEELLEDSELGRSFHLLNYAVSGHGVDQSLLLLRKSLDRHAALEPVVVLAFVLESDMDRATLTFFTRPKPRFRSMDDAFVLEPPDELDVLAFLERHPPSIQSYFWRYLAGGVFPLETRRRWEGEPARREELQALSGFLLREFGRECTDRALEHFVLLFHTRQALEAAPRQGEREAHALMGELGLSWVDSRADVERALARPNRTLEELYGETSHPSGLGIAVLFEALARGLRGEFDRD